MNSGDNGRVLQRKKPQQVADELRALIVSGQLGEGAAISTAMIPFLLAAILVSWFGLQRRKWQQGENND